MASKRMKIEWWYLALAVGALYLWQRNKRYAPTTGAASRQMTEAEAAAGGV